MVCRTFVRSYQRHFARHLPPREQKNAVEEIAIKAHKILGLRDYSVSDFIVMPKGIYLLEVNNNPKCAECSMMAKSLNAVGSDIGELADHLITLALERR